MRFRFRREPARLHWDYPERRRLPSNLPAVTFMALFSASWQPGGSAAPHEGQKAAIALGLREIARAATEQWDPEDVLAAQDAANAALGAPVDQPELGVLGLTGTVQLWLTEEAAATARQHRTDHARVARLRFLKAHLYNDPELLLLDHLERRPQDMRDSGIVKEFQKVARSIRVGGEVWYPLLEALEEMSTKGAIADADVYAMRVVLKVLREAMPELIDRHGLRTQAELLLDGFGEEPNGSGPAR
ncbi:hypothetical protein OG500_35360 [Kitasatospora sp. NBC_01250]|uniref:hypothetical protein n=1 Tax=unclassified Kitasatospora TaxID=2633591 RepID=UPI002E144AB8|nr:MULTISPECIES: hypothetical protein [unclassified Kitasatospora]WSJ71225.1 hypothetical protein OG294_36865 [Kitasatospora sp. NBC_01302]